MTAHRDFYDEAQQLAAALFERGQFDWSNEIEEAIGGGSTATEILMRVRSAIRQLLRSDVPTATERDAAKLLVSGLDDLLN